jgi:hypothetical protein
MRLVRPENCLLMPPFVPFPFNPAIPARDASCSLGLQDRRDRSLSAIRWAARRR